MSHRKNIVSIEDLNASYNGTPILSKLNLQLQEGEICAVIGEEGAGKSTLVKAITQQLKGEGRVSFAARQLSSLSTDKLVKYGVDFIGQGGNILKNFTVEEHIRLALSGTKKGKKSIMLERIGRTFPKLTQLRNQIAGKLSGGERMILSMACLMATDSAFLILDEPTAGLAPEVCKTVGAFLLEVKNANKTILLMEHNYEFALEIADSVVTLKDGRLSEKYFRNVFGDQNFVETKLYN